MKKEDLSRNNLQLATLLSYAVRNEVSDIHLKVGYKPIVRIHGQLKRTDTVELDILGMSEVIKSVLNEAQQAVFHEKKNFDSSLTYEMDGKSKRFRVNAALDSRGPYVVMRVIPEKIIDIQEVGFPNDVWKDIVGLKKGLVLVTGVTGSGKTTTLASIIQEINRTRGEHIITLEDPIEYIHNPQKSIISQREIGSNLSSFGDGVKYALREDPDVILVGEIRDRETAEKALEATATGHLVLSTLHTASASETVRRYVRLFETEDHENVRDTLAANLAYVLSQQLIPFRKGDGRSLAMEVMNVQASTAIRHHIREEKYELITDDISRGKASKMLTMDQHLLQLNRDNKITNEEAIAYAREPDQMRKNYENS